MPSTGSSVHNTLSTYAYPVIGNLPVQGINTGMVMQIL